MNTIIQKRKNIVWIVIQNALISFIILGSYNAPAQETTGIHTGVVRDKNAVLADVMVFNKTKNDTTVSLLNGDYEILADKGDIIEFTLTGYKTKTITVKSVYHKNIKLKTDKALLKKTFTITGTISDELGPLPGSSVFIKRNKTYTQTDIDGKYSIEVKKGDKLIFYYLGYEEFTVKVENQTEIHIILKNEGKLL